MSEQVIRTLTDPSFLISLLVAVAVFFTLMSALPALGGDPLKNRMKSVALEREQLRAKQRSWLANDDKRKGSLREQQSTRIREIVDRLDLRRALAAQAAADA